MNGGTLPGPGRGNISKIGPQDLERSCDTRCFSQPRPASSSERERERDLGTAIHVHVYACVWGMLYV